MVFDDSVDMAQQARYAFEFCAEESCGKCTPCRIGSVRGEELVRRRSIADGPRADRLSVLDDLCDLHGGVQPVRHGQHDAHPVRSALKHFPEDFGLPAEGP